VIETNILKEFLGFKKFILVYTENAILFLIKVKAQDLKGVYERFEGFDKNNFI